MIRERNYRWKRMTLTWQALVSETLEQDSNLANEQVLCNANASLIGQIRKWCSGAFGRGVVGVAVPSRLRLLREVAREVVRDCGRLVGMLVGTGKLLRSRESVRPREEHESPNEDHILNTKWVGSVWAKKPLSEHGRESMTVKVVWKPFHKESSLTDGNPQNWVNVGDNLVT